MMPKTTQSEAAVQLPDAHLLLILFHVKVITLSLHSCTLNVSLNGEEHIICLNKLNKLKIR